MPVDPSPPERISLPKADADSQPHVQTYHMGRSMRFFSVAESELDSITSFNSLATFGFAAGSFILALIMPDILNLFTDYWLGKTISPEAMTKFLVKGIVTCILSLVFYGIGGWGIWKKRSRWNKVGQESFPR